MKNLSIKFSPLPSFQELLDTTYTNPSLGTKGLLWHAAMADMVVFHADVASFAMDELLDWLIEHGYKGIKDDCGKCPLARAYYSNWLHILVDRGLLPVSWSNVQMFTTDAVLSCRSQLGHTGFTIELRFALSTTQKRFITAFDHGEIEELQEDELDMDDE
jgi:hypothetical protein